MRIIESLRFKAVVAKNNTVIRGVALTLLLFGLFGFTAGATENTIKISGEHFNNLGVSLGKLTAASQIPVLYAPAKVVIPPAQEFIVSASQPGLVAKLNAAVGDKVKKGDVLAQINSPALLALQGQYLKAGSVLHLATATYNRDKKLLKDGVISDRREQETLSQYNAALLDANEARQLLEIAGMSANDINSLGNSHRLNSMLNVLAPISGVVIERMAVAGTRIDSLTPIYRIANLDELWLEINIPQERMANIKIGDKVLIENSTSGQDLEQRKEVSPLPVSAQISLLGQSVNPENQTLLARAVIKGAQSAVRPGQKINIQIIQLSDKAIYTIPNVAIAQNEGKSFIFVRNQTGFQVVPVNIIGKQEEDSIISGELTGNEEIAIKGAVALKANWLGLGSVE